ncbi:MAG: TetR/AcrR family transcriptional regulator [Polyangiaceae bacterium]|nr:TetR/AcrR family transcriptional regulator [Polyangiaceae bacterium]
MSDRGRKTRERMIELSSELLERSGYHGLSLGELVSNAGAPRGSIYHHFPGGKDELVALALEQATVELGSALNTLAATSKSSSEAVARTIDFLASRMESASYKKGCPIAATALDASSLPRELAMRCRAAYERFVSILARRIAQDGVPEEEAEELAVTILSAVEGALLLARVEQRRAPLEATGRVLVRMLDAARLAAASA